MKKLKPTLDQKMKNLGFTISCNETSKFAPIDFDIERDILDTIVESRKDYRVLGLLCVWFKKHADTIIIEKFFKLISKRDDINPSDYILNFLIATAIAHKHSKWKRWLKTDVRNPIFPIDKDNLKAAVKVKGSDEALRKLGVLVPNGFLKIDESKVYNQELLAKYNKQYRNRLIIGPNWRADIITAIELGLENPFKISNTIGCGYESAYRVMKEYRIAHSLI